MCTMFTREELGLLEFCYREIMCEVHSTLDVSIKELGERVANSYYYMRSLAREHDIAFKYYDIAKKHGMFVYKDTDYSEYLASVYSVWLQVQNETEDVRDEMPF